MQKILCILWELLSFRLNLLSSFDQLPKFAALGERGLKPLDLAVAHLDVFVETGILGIDESGSSGRTL